MSSFEAVVSRSDPNSASFTRLGIGTKNGTFRVQHVHQSGAADYEVVLEAGIAPNSGAVDTEWETAHRFTQETPNFERDVEGIHGVTYRFRHVSGGTVKMLIA